MKKFYNPGARDQLFKPLLTKQFFFFLVIYFLLGSSLFAKIERILRDLVTS